MKAKRIRKQCAPALAMARRYGTTTTTMRDRRTERGGARNRQREYRDQAEG